LALGKLTASDILNLGSSTTENDQFVSNKKVNILEQVDFVRALDNEHDRTLLAKTLASKIPLAARVDAFSDSSQSGKYGEKLRAEILEKFHKRTTREPTEEAPLPRPEARPTAKRGGWKARLRKKRAQELAQVSKDAAIETAKDDVATTMDWYD